MCVTPLKALASHIHKHRLPDVWLAEVGRNVCSSRCNRTGDIYPGTVNRVNQLTAHYTHPSISRRRRRRRIAWQRPSVNRWRSGLVLWNDGHPSFHCLPRPSIDLASYQLLSFSEQPSSSSLYSINVLRRSATMERRCCQKCVCNAAWDVVSREIYISHLYIHIFI